MNKTEVKRTEVPLEEPICDIIWQLYDYLWIRTEKGIYLSRDQGATFTKVRWWKFMLTNIKHMFTDLFQKWVKS